MAVSLKIYIPYCSNQPAANDRVQELKQTVQNGLKKMRLHPDSKGLELSGMLIKPLQRLCKYPLLLRVRVEISFSLFFSHHETLKRGLERMEELLSYLNEKKREAEAFAELIQIHNSMVFGRIQPLQLVMPSRKLLLRAKFPRIL